MLYLMLIVVFSKLSNKWWFFMLLGYCELSVHRNICCIHYIHPGINLNLVASVLYTLLSCYNQALLLFLLLWD